MPNSSVGSLGIISRGDAKSRGLKFYFKGAACAHGHIDVWYVSVGVCKSCARESAQKNRQRRRADPELSAIDEARAKKRYWNDPQKFRDKANLSRKPLSDEQKLSDSERRKREYRENIDREKAVHKKWRVENAEKKRLLDAQWQRDNPDRVKQRNKRWQEKNKDAVRSFTRNYRAKKKAAEGSHAAGDIMALFDRQCGLCACGCGVSIATNYDVDHMIPISRGGVNWPSNLQLLTPSCNKSKNDKTMEEWMAIRDAPVVRIGAKT